MGEWVGDRYALHDELGAGGIALVYRAWDQQRGDWVALKRLRPGLQVSRAIRARFRTEVLALQTLDHPGVVKVRDHGASETSLWIAMELVEGATLHHWMTTHGAMPPRLAVDAVLQVCAAIDAAHAQGIVHRDVKPHNVLVDPAGACRVVDFGLARLIEDPGSLTRTGLTMGTWGYMSPEQVSDAKRADARTDIFALGALLLALVCGRDPVDAGRDVARFGDRLPEALRWPLTRATLSDPAHRHRSVARLARSLTNAREALAPDPPGTPGLHLPLSTPSPSSPTVVP